MQEELDNVEPSPNPQIPADDTTIRLPGRRVSAFTLRDLVDNQGNEEVLRMSCCYGNPRGVMFFSALLISVLVISFSGVMIALKPSDPERLAIFLPILMGVVGIWLPNPKLASAG